MSYRHLLGLVNVVVWRQTSLEGILLRSPQNATLSCALALGIIALTIFRKEPNEKRDLKECGLTED